MTLLTLIDLVAVAVFSVTGALSASRRGMDVVGFLWLGAVTGVGGGTIRDLLLGAPVFWVKDPRYLVVAVVAATAVYFVAPFLRQRYPAILWLDAVGLAFVSVAGASKSLELGSGPVIAVVMGVITATLGGIFRDILAHQPSILLRKEIYITASMFGAVVFVGAIGLGAGEGGAAASGLIAGFSLRAGAILRGWRLPSRAEPEGETDDGKTGRLP